MNGSTVYVETTVFSYLTSRPARDPLVAVHQRLTREWWGQERMRFRLVASAVVLQEVEAGDKEVAARRRALLEGLPFLEITSEVQVLARHLIDAALVPARVPNDALHLAVATVGRADYLLTWNLRHLAGAVARRRIEHELRKRGYDPPTLCTPEELRGDDEARDDRAGSHR